MAQSKSKLFVGGLGQNASESNLCQTFDKFGTIVDACIVYDKETGNSRGFGYVTFSEPADAECAMNALRGMEMSTGENAITGTNTTPGTELNALGPSLENSSGGRSQVNADKRDDTSGINVVQQMDQNNVGKENAGSVEQGMTATKTRTGEGMKETLGLNGGKDSNTRENTDDGYIDEIKRRKFEKKAKSKLFVGGLVQDVREEFLHEKFEKYGEIVDACIVYEKGTNISRGFGYVTFHNEKDAEEAIKGVDGMRVNGKTLCVEFADDPKHTRSRRPPPRRRSRSRSPRRLRDRYPSPPPFYRDRYLDREPYYDRDSYFARDRYERDCYESERYYRRDPYDPYYPPRDYYRPPHPPDYRDYRRSPPRMPPPPVAEYKDRLGREIPPPSARAPRISDVDHARLRVDRERLRMSQRLQEDDGRTRESRPYRSPSPDYRSSRNSRVEDSRNTTRGRYSDSNSSDDDNVPNVKPRQVSAFPSAYLT